MPDPRKRILCWDGTDWLPLDQLADRVLLDVIIRRLMALEALYGDGPTSQADDVARDYGVLLAVESD